MQLCVDNWLIYLLIADTPYLNWNLFSSNPDNSTNNTMVCVFLTRSVHWYQTKNIHRQSNKGICFQQRNDLSNKLETCNLVAWGNKCMEITIWKAAQESIWCCIINSVSSWIVVTNICQLIKASDLIGCYSNKTQILWTVTHMVTKKGLDTFVLD